MKQYNFDGPFADEIKFFIEYKRKLGFKYISIIPHLYNFDQFCKLQKNVQFLTKNLMHKWINQNPNNKKSSLSYKSNVMRQLSIYMNEKNNNHEILPYKLYRRKEEFVPYIFSDDEIIKILKEADNYKNKFYYNKQFIVSLVFRLLYTTGMRITECLTIKISDFNFTEGTILLKDTKNGKDRLIALSNDVFNRCIEFNKLFNKNLSQDNYFFRNENGSCYTGYAFYSIFRIIIDRAGIKFTSKGPKLHSIRHTFAVHSFRNLIRNNNDLNIYIPVLSAYLGHSSLIATEKYLRLTADMYDDIREKIEKNYSDLIQEMEDFEDEE